MLTPVKGKHSYEEAEMKWLPTCAVPIILTAGSAYGASEPVPLPNWQIKDICAKESAPGQCAAFEGEALRTVSATWAFVADPIKQTCFAQLKSPADRSWRCWRNASMPRPSRRETGPRSRRPRRRPSRFLRRDRLSRLQHHRHLLRQRRNQSCNS
jgi:hypothetical protein